MKKFMWLVAIVAVLALVGCQAKDDETAKKDSQKSDEPSLEKVTVVLDWTPNTNHTGLYVAQQQGYFKEQGLDVEIIQPGDAGADQLIASGKADFGVSYQEGITQARVQGVPLVSIAAIIQHNTSGFASPKDKNIASPKDFEGKTYGGWGSPIEKAVIETIMKADQADVSKMEIINAGDTDFFTMTEKDVDFAWIYYGWTGVEAELRGKDINMVYLTDYSDKLDYYTPVLATNEKMIEKQPEIVEKFVAGAAQGYEFAIDKPEEAANILLTAEPDLAQDLVINSQKWLADKYQDDASQWGVQKLDIWKNYAEWMTENGVLEGEFDPEKAFTNDFLPKK
ncbi:ABC transporter substrate-binding protein [Lysinibacillus alkalisoli]|uniref:ABC transporter substrate-binding protein n=1 Tax=Lysinibacillus alkalisoli TaxID=1911548 RepID=A0A917G0D2_9BACI|nr:ABC transporter substrate-binding protein [Lysinibacillus alkalisoli]GGG16531.1 ABC transporter substrate-binding protein [Lysinibacillus alkalisoli]